MRQINSACIIVDRIDLNRPRRAVKNVDQTITQFLPQVQCHYKHDLNSL